MQRGECVTSRLNELSYEKEHSHDENSGKANGEKPLKPGTELRVIKKWETLEDELDELKKIYFTFLKRWTDGSQHKDEPNKAVIYEVHSDEDILELA